MFTYQIKAEILVIRRLKQFSWRRQLESMRKEVFAPDVQGGVGRNWLLGAVTAIGRI
jgi:hypothetical protein